MKSTAKKKLFINNMITLGMVVAAWIIMEVLIGHRTCIQPFKGTPRSFLYLRDHGGSLNLTVGILVS